MKNKEQFELVSAGSPTTTLFSVVELLMRNHAFIEIFNGKPKIDQIKLLIIMAFDKINVTYPEASCDITLFNVNEILNQELADLPNMTNEKNRAVFQRVTGNKLAMLEAIKAKSPVLVKLTPKIDQSTNLCSHFFICELADFKLADAEIRLKQNIKG